MKYTLLGLGMVFYNFIADDLGKSRSTNKEIKIILNGIIQRGSLVHLFNMYFIEQLLCIRHLSRH